MFNFEEAGKEEYWCFWILVLEKTPKNTMDSQESKNKKKIIKLINLEFYLKAQITKLKLSYYVKIYSSSQEKVLWLGKWKESSTTC